MIGGRKKVYSLRLSWEPANAGKHNSVDKKMAIITSLTIRITKSVLLSALFISTLGSANALANGPVNTAQMKAARNQEAEQLLSDLGYWITKVDGKADDSTRQGIIAFQKVEGLKRTGVLDEKVLRELRLAGKPVPKHQGPAHVEIDITRQVIFLVDDAGEVTKVLSTSTGNGERYFSEGKWQRAYTPRGTFKIQRQIKGVRKAPLGTIYNPSYFNGGIAIHGSNSIPVKAASHGCARIPRFADKQFVEMVKVGMPVYVYD